MSEPQACDDLGHLWPIDMVVLALKPKAIAEVTCARCGIVRTTIIDEVSVQVRWTLAGTIIEETVELKSGAPVLGSQGRAPGQKRAKHRSWRIARPWGHAHRML